MCFFFSSFFVCLFCLYYDSVQLLISSKAALDFCVLRLILCRFCFVYAEWLSCLKSHLLYSVLCVVNSSLTEVWGVGLAMKQLICKHETKRDSIRHDSVSCNTKRRNSSAKMSLQCPFSKGLH